MTEAITIGKFPGTFLILICPGNDATDKEKEIKRSAQSRSQVEAVVVANIP